MKKLLPILVLLLASCNSQANEEAGATEGGGEAPAPAALPPVPGGEDPAALQARVSRAMAVGLPGSANAQYRGLRTGAGGSACGEVATQGKGPAAGIFRPFVVTPEAMSLVAATPTIAYDDPDDIFADAWIRWCATPEELRRIGPALKQVAESNVVETVPDPHIPLPGETDLPPPTPADRPPPRPVAAKAGPPPAIDSFFNSVQRQGE